MSLSLSRSLRQTKALPRDRNTDDDVLSALSLAFVSIAEKRQRGVCLSAQISARVCSNSVDRWEILPKSFALCLCPVLLSRPKDARKTSPASTRALSTVSQCPRISPNRVLASVKRERNDPKFVRKLLLFFLFLYSPIKCSQFSQRAGESETTRAARSFFSNPTHTGRR